MAKDILKSIGSKTQGVFNVIPKEVRVSIAVVGAGFLAYKLYTMLNPNEEKKQLNQLEKEAEGCKNRLTYNLSQYKSWADNLYDAFFNSVGTDEDMVLDIINKMRTECDLKQLIADFGLRRPEWSFGDDKNLTYFMRDELTKSELADVNRILRTKGITIQF